MNVLKGKAEKLRIGVEVTGSNDQVSSTHVATLLLAGKAVRMEMPNAFLLSEGDALIVAGLPGKDGVFKAYAYRNADNGARGWTAGLGALISGLIFSCVGIGAAVVVLISLLGGFGSEILVRLGGSAFASIFMLAFGAGGMQMIKTYVYSGRARAAVG